MNIKILEGMRDLAPEEGSGIDEVRSILKSYKGWSRKDGRGKDTG